jgi:hypothetical protein
MPVQVTGLYGVVAIAAGACYNLALKGDGTVWAWGSNLAGQLGDGTTMDKSMPEQVSGLSGVMAITAGGAHSMALKADGTVWTEPAFPSPGSSIPPRFGPKKVVGDVRRSVAPWVTAPRCRSAGQ